MKSTSIIASLVAIFAFCVGVAILANYNSVPSLSFHIFNLIFVSFEFTISIVFFRLAAKEEELI